MAKIVLLVKSPYKDLTQFFKEFIENLQLTRALSLLVGKMWSF